MSPYDVPIAATGIALCVAFPVAVYVKFKVQEIKARRRTR